MHTIKKTHRPMSGLLLFLLVMFFLLSVAIGLNVADGLSTNFTLLTGHP